MPLILPPGPSLAIRCRNHQKSLAYFSPLPPLILFFFTKRQSQKRENTIQCPPKYASQCWQMQRTWACLGRSTLLNLVFVEHESTVQVQAPLYKKIQDRNFVSKKNPEYALLIFLACIYCYLLGLTTELLKMTH